jgi:hypothetical protein
MLERNERHPMTADSAEREFEVFVMKAWRQSGLPEYFLGNGGTNVRLCEFASRIMEAARQQASTDTRQCTCHPDDRPTVCQKQYAASECQKQASTEAAQGWMDIATAPKDGSVILLCAHPYVFAGCWYRDGQIPYDAKGTANDEFPWLVFDPTMSSGLNAYMEGRLTHWMPLSFAAAPTAESRKEESNG